MVYKSRFHAIIKSVYSNYYNVHSEQSFVRDFGLFDNDINTFEIINIK